MKSSRFHKAVREFQTFIISEELAKFNGNIVKTAISLGLHRNSLSRHIDHLGINVEKTKHGTNGAKVDGNPADTTRPIPMQKLG